MALYKGYGIDLDGTTISGVTTQGLVSGTEDRQESTAGQPYPEHLVISAQNPRFTFSTTDIKTAHDAIGVFGLNVAGSLGTDALNIFEAQIDNTGQIMAGSVHRRFQLRNCYILPRQWTCDHQGDISCDYEVMVRWDGTNDPIAINESAALPSGLSDAIRWSYSKATLGAVVMNQMTSITITPGVNGQMVGVDSDHWPKFFEIEEILPRVTFRGIDPAQFSASGVPLIGKLMTHANTSVFFRKRTMGLASYVADITAEHLKFTFDGMIRAEDILNAQRNARGEISFEMPLRYDGTNAPITLATASAIT